ncbi:lytic transglycosylase domain-containing protein [Caulobacter hibisci]|uniref:Lytic transglycosylase domain-containing protein n=1 Tax=Caulobacter hibisci TaxID=2035993 RepID=A0ABS0T0D7_9CAUL|nr:lytic transglycosylase domain-containing protein [Caulobacter hibisci]MBI1685176.1 lytic transglycosylase domain-containing protein [Caulobacter hibisci]
MKPALHALLLAVLVGSIAPAAKAQDRRHVQTSAARFGLSEDLIVAVIAAESAGDPRAVSPAGAMGLMQLMPATWAELRARLGLGDDPFDPRDNVTAGSAYLRELLDRYGAPGFLAAYNAGPRRYEQSLAGRPLPAETRAYVQRLTGGGLAPPRLADWRAAGLFASPWPADLGSRPGYETPVRLDRGDRPEQSSHEGDR